jgi:two-component system response regulator RegA
MNYLLIDDDSVFTSVLARVLTRRGYSVTTACNGDEAMDQCRQTPIHRVVLDLKLERESGLSILQQLRDLQPEIQVVLLTGYSSISTAVEAIKLGAVNYLGKPASVDEIISAFEPGQIEQTQAIQTSPPSVGRVEWEHIQRVLNENDGNISATARILGMHRRTLQRKLQKRPVKQ